MIAENDKKKIYPYVLKMNLKKKTLGRCTHAPPERSADARAGDRWNGRDNIYGACPVPEFKSGYIC